MSASLLSGSAPQWVFSMVVVAGVGVVAVQQLNEPEPIEVVPAPLEQVVPVFPEIIEPPVAEVVRIDGEIATIAGTGNPGETIIIMSGTDELAQTIVGADGTYAAVFNYQVPENGAKLDLFETQEDGANIAAENSIAVLPKVGADPDLAQIDGDVIKVEVDNRDELTFAGIVYGDGDAAVISGNSTPNTVLNVSVDGALAGETTVDASGTWKVTLADLSVGKHTLSFKTDDDQSFLVPIERAAIETTQKIARGDTLWRIAELHLGDGNRYVDIYNMNADKINNPDLIYPDQDLILPTK